LQSALHGVFDLAVVGAGIIGLACARAAALKGLRVIVIDRDSASSGASVRNFGFVDRSVVGCAPGCSIPASDRGTGCRAAPH
jgi:D-hydroxyproline dehydrogenase subunit beta